MGGEPDGGAAHVPTGGRPRVGRPRKWASEAERKRAYRERLATDIVRDITDAETRTRTNTRIDVNICVNYGSRDEIVRATRRLARRAAAV